MKRGHRIRFALASLSLCSVVMATRSRRSSRHSIIDNHSCQQQRLQDNFKHDDGTPKGKATQSTILEMLSIEIVKRYHHEPRHCYLGWSIPYHPSKRKVPIYRWLDR